MDFSDTRSATWERCTFVNSVDEYMSQVYFIDIGKFSIVKNSHIYDLSSISEILAEVPPQAIKVRLTYYLNHRDDAQTMSLCGKL